MATSYRDGVDRYRLQQNATPAATSQSLDTTDADTAKQTIALALPKNFGRATGDWDQEEGSVI
jgi:hypothetical protein